MRSTVFIIYLLLSVLAVCSLAAQTLEENEITELRKENEEMRRRLNDSRTTPSSDELSELRRENLDLIQRLDRQLERQEKSSTQSNTNNDSDSDPNNLERKFGIGFPIGVLSNDLLLGLDFAIPFSPVVALRVEGITLLQYDNKKNGIDSAVLAPGLGLMLRFSDPSKQLRVYGMYLINVHYDIYQRGTLAFDIGSYILGGIEYFFNRSLAFFAEAGGGYKFSTWTDYGTGPVLRFGTRIYSYK